MSNFSTIYKKKNCIFRKILRCLNLPFEVTSLNSNIFHQFLLHYHVIFMIVNCSLICELPTS